MPEVCDPCGVKAEFYTAFRGYRSAQPPATFWQASGLLRKQPEDEPEAGADNRRSFGLRLRQEIRCSFASSAPSLRQLRLSFELCVKAVKLSERREEEARIVF